ncbi:MAG TPA: efflux RND transporter periplasmic adaptor subunit [Ignavibacteriales bacterium]|nr:efflux RND transporter periplasmic adaptor subunit [Ignavibacteriales bacterium]
MIVETKNIDLSSLRINRTEEKRPPDRTKKIVTRIVGSVLLLVLAFIVYSYVNSLLDKKEEVKLTTVTLQTGAYSSAVLNSSGYVVAQRKAAVASKGTGRLVFLGVVEGDQVRKDQIIARLEDNDIKAQLDQAKANLKLAEADLKDAENFYKRQKELTAKGLISQQEFETAEARYNRTLAIIDLASAQVTAAEVAMENTLIRAPFDGTVLTKNADVGEIVSPFGASINSRAAVVTMADMTSLQVEADVSESNIEKITLNQECEIVLDAYPEKSYPGFVAKIVPTADRSKATVLVKVGFKEYDSRVLPEMSAKVTFLTRRTDKDEDKDKEKPILLAPSSATGKRNGRDVVFVVKDDKAVEVQVQLGRKFGDNIEIISGVSSGESIIDKLTEKIKDGIAVKVL